MPINHNNSILVLVDFTETSKKAVDQAANIARLTNSELRLCHITGADENEAEVRNDLEQYLREVEINGLEADILMRSGEFMNEVQDLVKHLKPALVVVGTHGSAGWKQHLLGSNIYKLVKVLAAPTLVINDDFQIVKKGFKKIVLPVAPHKDFIKKVKQSVTLLAADGQLEIFAIAKPGVDLDEKIQQNIDAGAAYLKEKDINFQYVEIDSTSFSVGYSRETLKYASANGVDLIAIMAQVSEENRSFGTMDKENMLLNESGIAIFCSNS